MYTKIYLNDEEHTWVKKQTPGFLRATIQELMQGKVPAESPPVIKSKSDIIFSKKMGDGLNTCKKCGSMLTMYKGKCKVCGK
jgi:hypothetical protein